MVVMITRILLLFGGVCRVDAHDTRMINVFPQRRCPECGGAVFVTDRAAGEVTCRACGLVLIDDLLDRTPEWRAFSPMEKVARTRTGSHVSLQHFDKGLSTTFIPSQSPFGTQISTTTRRTRARHAVEGKSPVGIAAATIYIAALLENTPITQQKIATVADVTEVTIRNRYQDLARTLDLDLVKS
jgi:transcription initiation factor TFIIIB Brf1 subunit/transcription initiation factor TFIIB